MSNWLGCQNLINTFIIRRKLKKNIQTIGIAVNLLDDLEIVYQLIQKINEELENLKIIVRLHPLDKRVLRNKNILFEKSNPAHEKAFEFLRKIYFLISGESSIPILKQHYYIYHPSSMDLMKTIIYTIIMNM